MCVRDQHVMHAHVPTKSSASTQAQAVRPNVSPRESPLQIKSSSSLLGETWGREQGPPGEPWFLPRAPPAFLYACFTFRDPSFQQRLWIGLSSRVPGLRELDTYVRARRDLRGQVEKGPPVTAVSQELYQG